ncbi:DUF362 domain-containing protein [Archaeoglobus veneficus]|uniref:4Fe-4S ferredoxin iron-sulfur binding domain-containing protein n=1 Tax=Archaeoglobus veneficus (strain DSM 11195 / SNP6) TaxID=693661 RepID=F2KNH3_ARCVS|nr:4Fe-4S binding protein [Archaeoglobus veneficus]AEA47375.1 4Fe-4S ferredoxin iron-sulfur binding domain-containing protein [Archaeoglobus veneficus SNP6]
MIVTTSSCVGCAFCKLVCPEEAIEVFGRAEIDSQKCVECKKCVIYCPIEAIKVVEE